MTTNRRDIIDWIGIIRALLLAAGVIWLAGAAVLHEIDAADQAPTTESEE